MSLFDSLGRSDPQQALSQLRSDPVSVLRQRGLNVPDGMNNPQQIINYLLQSGQISNPRLQMAQRMMAGLRR